MPTQNTPFRQNTRSKKGIAFEIIRIWHYLHNLEKETTYITKNFGRIEDLNLEIERMRSLIFWLERKKERLYLKVKKR